MNKKITKSAALFLGISLILTFGGNIGAEAASKKTAKTVKAVKSVKSVKPVKTVKQSVTKIMTVDQAIKMFKTKYNPIGDTIYENGKDGKKDLVINGIKYYCILNFYNGGSEGYALNFFINSKTGEVWSAKRKEIDGEWKIVGLDKKINNAKELEKFIWEGF